MKTESKRVLKQVENAYSGPSERPLGSYAIVLATYAGLVSGAAVYVRKRGLLVPARIRFSDMALGAVATYRLSRLITKDSVTAVGRAPFTRFKEAAGEGEVNEDVRGHGVRHAVGELVSCPFCIAQWIATAYAFGLIIAPRATRWAAGVLAMVSVSDALQFGHAALMRTEQGDRRNA